MVDVGSIVVFLLVHVIFVVLSKLLSKWISIVFYLLLLSLFFVYYYQISLFDVLGFTSAVVVDWGNFSLPW